MSKRCSFDEYEREVGNWVSWSPEVERRNGKMHSREKEYACRGRFHELNASSLGELSGVIVMMSSIVGEEGSGDGWCDMRPAIRRLWSNLLASKLSFERG